MELAFLIALLAINIVGVCLLGVICSLLYYFGN